MSKFLFAAGGTGGHVFPAVAVANAARAMDANAEVLFVGTAKGFEAKLVPQAGYPLELMDIAGLKGKGILSKLKSLLMLPKAFLKSRRILQKFSPSSVFGIGGYVSGPIMLLASFRKSKTAILEPNSTPGFSNRVLSKFVDRVFVAFEEAMSRFPSSKCTYSGNPIREDILSILPPTFEGEERTILIFGGSQGARRINQALTSSLPLLKPFQNRIRIIHQTGEADLDQVRKAYLEHGFQAEVEPFIQNMAGAYAKADIVIARSGSSVLEIAACGRPSILVPYPYAADDHQETNARVLERAGAALYIGDTQCDAERMSAALISLLENKTKLQEMSRKALALRKADAASTIARYLVGEDQ